MTADPDRLTEAHLRALAAPGLAPQTRYACWNCAWTGVESELEDLRHAEQRVAPGEPYPAGECPECGACCHEETD